MTPHASLLFADAALFDGSAEEHRPRQGALPAILKDGRFVRNTLG